jgi:hypothetical protein
MNFFAHLSHFESKSSDLYNNNLKNFSVVSNTFDYQNIERIVEDKSVQWRCYDFNYEAVGNIF